MSSPTTILGAIVAIASTGFQPAATDSSEAFNVVTWDVQSSWLSITVTNIYASDTYGNHAPTSDCAIYATNQETSDHSAIIKGQIPNFTNPRLDYGPNPGTYDVHFVCNISLSSPGLPNFIDERRVVHFTDSAVTTPESGTGSLLIDLFGSLSS